LKAAARRCRRHRPRRAAVGQPADPCGARADDYGALAIEPTYRAVAATFGTSWFDTLRSVLLPATLPYVFVGLRVSLGLAFVSVVAAEMVAGDSGIGFYITSTQYAGRGADMFAALFLVGLSGYVINRAFVAIEDRILFWHRQSG
jgi:ABC-type nitrate/sulfonate/bicarbonate transport system permease component